MLAVNGLASGLLCANGMMGSARTTQRRIAAVQTKASLTPRWATTAYVRHCSHIGVGFHGILFKMQESYIDHITKHPPMYQDDLVWYSNTLTARKGTPSVK